MFLVHSRLPKEILVSFKAEFGPYEGEISRLSQEVRDEASLASKQAQKQENELQATHRQNWMKFTKDYYTTKAEENDRRLEVNRRKLEKNRLEALDALSTYNYQKTYKQLRKECVPGTSIWICGNPVFHKWLSGAFQTLWLIGRSIIRFLEAVLDNSRQYFIVLDGLDECEEAEIKEVADVFHDLLLLPRLHIKFFWSSRPNVQNWLPGRFLTKQHIDLGTVENQDKIACDIRTFVHLTLEEWLDGDTPKVRINDPTIIITILDCLEKGAQGMFLWVRLQLYTLRQKRSNKQIIAALNDLPRNLPETFMRILSRYTEADDIDIGRQIFCWVAIAKRPLTVEELREAIGTKPLQETWNDSSYINDMNNAIACCGNLVFIEEEQQTVHFTHRSVKQYLLSDAVQKSSSKHFIDLRKADEDAGAVSITYLNFPIFDRQVARKVDNSISATDITTTVVRNSLPLGKTANKIALNLLRRGDKLDKPVHDLLSRSAGDINVNRQQNSLRDYPFLLYAKQFWLEHTKQEFDSNSKKLLRLWCILIAEADWRDTFCGVPWTPKDWDNRDPRVFRWIVEQNHCSLAQLIISSDVELTQQNLKILVEGAASRGYTRLIEISLGSAELRLYSAEFSRTILKQGLRAAAEGGHLDVVERLLQAKAKVNASDIEGRTALQLAAEGGHLDVVERLLQAKAEVNAATKFTGTTALHIAAEGGHLNIVKRLLQAKAEVNASDILGRTVLQVTAESGHLDVVERLLQAKAEVNATKFWGTTALQLAAEGGHLDVVERLLQAKAEVNAIDRLGRTALKAAVEGGHSHVVERLRIAGAK
ncbi:MAG: hypothetical protein LQ351_006213 [Letrouitia transgressa]|nr:MAG: hypothetical protein LQ351_006213 [Letrouitia transgressa]